ncbi:MAG TPA: SDR family NAD(P)-dependent oxidoreductase [Afifellaceae bacterium]|nr:SDR family NAD(P)-dependent oxidoreductase [Afifellaceae bacterium]
MLNIFDGRRVLITGASAGIGLSLVRKISLFGAEVLACGRRPRSDLPGDFPDVAYRSIDLAGPGAAGEIVAAVEALDWDTLDILILNAGTGRYAGIDADDAESIAGTVRVNLAAPVAITHALSGRLLAAHGRLVLVGSVARKGSRGFPVYAATKAAVNGFARSLRSEWQDRVTVQVFHPGPVATEMHARAGYDAGWLRKLFLKPDDVAEVMIRRMPRGGSPQTIGYRAVIRMKESGFLRGAR